MAVYAIMGLAILGSILVGAAVLVVLLVRLMAWLIGQACLAIQNAEEEWDASSDSGE